MSFIIESPAFKAQTMIPELYTCQGKDISPPLTWKAAGLNAQSYVLIVDDPDAPGGTWVHWILFNIPGNLTQLAAGTTLPPGTVSGLNSWGTTGYRGPCPPSGTHHYVFKFYALDTLLDLPSNTTAQELMQAMQGHILAKRELIGLYKK